MLNINLQCNFWRIYVHYGFWPCHEFWSQWFYFHFLSFKKKYSEKQTRNNFKNFFPLFTIERLPTDLYLCWWYTNACTYTTIYIIYTNITYAWMNLFIRYDMVCYAILTKLTKVNYCPKSLEIIIKTKTNKIHH